VGLNAGKVNGGDRKGIRPYFAPELQQIFHLPGSKHHLPRTENNNVECKRKRNKDSNLAEYIHNSG